jgi:hypothetical protein
VKKDNLIKWNKNLYKQSLKANLAFLAASLEGVSATG